MTSRRFQGALVALIAALAMPAAAQAACPVLAVSNPFAPFGDQAQYALAPGGGFESATPGWSLTGAALVAGNQTMTGAGGQRALRLPLAASAVSPSFCVGPEHPTMRLFVRQLSGAPGQLKVEVLFAGNKAKKLGVVSGAGRLGAWAPSPVLPLALGMPAKNLNADVQLRITAEAGGTWEIDDVYIDPRAL